MHPNEIVRILKEKNAAQLFESVCEMYRDVRIFGFTDEEQDMLLFQYGPVDWGQGERFELDLTRQFMRKDGDIFQLRSAIIFELSGKLRSISEMSAWCSSTGELDSFIQTIEHSPGYLCCRALVPKLIDVEYYNV